MKFENLKNTLNEINIFFSRSNSYHFGFFKRSNIPKSLIKLIEYLNSNNINTQKLFSSLNSLISDLYNLQNKNISDIEKAQINRFLTSLEQYKNSLTQERRKFLKTTAKIATGILASQILKPFESFASSNSLFTFKKEKMIALGYNYFDNFGKIASEITKINIRIIRNRKTERFSLENNLVKNLVDHAIIIDGYLNYIEIHTNKRIDISVYNQKVNFEVTKIGRIGFVYSFPKGIRGVIFSQVIPTERVIFIIKDGVRSYNFMIYQSPIIKLGKLDIESKKSYDDLYFRYSGNNIVDFNKIDNIKIKLYSIARGVYNVEKFFNVNLIDYCELMDYDLDNAIQNERGIAVYYGILIMPNSNSNVMENISEHETLHRLDEVYRGLSANKKFNDLFVDLLGYTSYRVEEERPKPKSKIFKFIDEENYFNTFGGHSDDDNREFFATFVHTVMYINLLESNLKNLSKEEAEHIMHDYKKVLITLISISPKQINNIFKQALYYIENKIYI